MRWFSRTRRGSIEPVWTFSTNATLWRLLPSRNGYFVGEDRDTSEKKVSFFCLDQQGGRICWSGVRFDEPWWIGLEAIHQGRVFVHEYAAPDMPDHKKIFALDLATGTLLWSTEELKFVAAHEERIYAAREHHEERQFFELDAESGTSLRQIDAGYLNVLRESIPADEYDFMEYPAIYMAQDPGVSHLRKWVEMA